MNSRGRLHNRSLNIYLEFKLENIRIGCIKLVLTSLRYDYNLLIIKSTKPALNARAQPSGDILGQCCKNYFMSSS